MKSVLLNSITLYLAGFMPIASSPAAFGQDKDDEELYELSPFSIDSGGFSGYGATPGGAQDINYARAQINLGNIPLPNTFTAEGLFSEHDLPLSSSIECDQLLCINGEAMPAQILTDPDAFAIGQIGFGSGLKPETWSPPPLNLIAVVDKSGSMSGQPLELVKKSLLKIVKQLAPSDQISIVLYGDRSHVFLPPTSVHSYNKNKIKETIKSIQSAGSTNMEAGLKVGYRLAEKSSESFEGSTRLMLFTDERPNVGNTSPEGFMGIMKSGSIKGIGLTTIGVGVQFGAELASEISSVRGGNLFYFPDHTKMVETFESEFSTMVTELAHDMRLKIDPVSGYKIAGVYGIPADLFSRGADNSVTLEIETLFLSLRQGALYFSLAKDGRRDLPRRLTRDGGSVAKVELSYREQGSKRLTSQSFEFRLVDRSGASLGLTRGENLINQYLSLRAASEAHHNRNDQETAYEILRELSSLLKSSGDSDLEAEIELVSQLENKLALLSGRQGEPLMKGLFSSGLVGSWLATPEDNESLKGKTIMRISPRGYLEFIELDPHGNIASIEKGVFTNKPSKKRKGVLALVNERAFRKSYSSLKDLPKSFQSASYTDIESITYHLKASKLSVNISWAAKEGVQAIEFKRANPDFSINGPIRNSDEGFEVACLLP